MSPLLYIFCTEIATDSAPVCTDYQGKMAVTKKNLYRFVPITAGKFVQILSVHIFTELLQGIRQ